MPITITQRSPPRDNPNRNLPRVTYRVAVSKEEAPDLPCAKYGSTGCRCNLVESFSIDIEIRDWRIAVKKRESGERRKTSTKLTAVPSQQTREFDHMMHMLIVDQALEMRTRYHVAPLSLALSLSVDGTPMVIVTQLRCPQ